jgi:DNA-binding beta-propeller fold protein YncE
MRKAFLVALVSLVATTANAQSHKLQKKWESKAELAVPESVVYDEQRQVLYTSNIDGEPWADDKKGSIGKLGLDGSIIAAEWVTGLSAPKGLALHGNFLYVGDMTEMVVVDVEKGAIAKRIPMPGAKGLNDVAAAPDGTVYASDSLGKKLYVLRNDKPEVYIDNLQGPNGVLVHKGSLYLLDGKAAYRVADDRSLKPFSTDIDGVIDGLEPISDTEFLISTWQGTVSVIKADGTRETLLDTRAQKMNAADIGYDPKKKIVYVPTFFYKTVAAYELK